jgi:hypothetical protein
MPNNIVFMDGFDFYNSATMPFTQRYGGSGSYTYGIAGRFGGQAMRFNNSGDKPIASLPAPTADIAVGFAVAAPWSSGDVIFAYLSGSAFNALVSFTFNTTGVLKVYKGFGDTFLGQATGLPVDTFYHYLELISHRDNAGAGTVQVWFDGVKVIDLTGLSLGTSDYYAVVLGNTQLGGPVAHYDFDDLYISAQSTRVGERRIELLRPNSDVLTAWVPDTGTAHFSRVNEATPDGDTSYVASGVVGAKDSYTVGSLSSTPQQIDAVQSVMVVRKTDATTRTVRSNIKSGTVTGTGVTRGVPSSYGLMYDIFNTDPNGSALWTSTAVNALNLGIELVA